jgi:CRP/FNR family cyclic AMP-dependent transcriptional regulator
MTSNAPVLERRFYPEGKVIVREGEDAFIAFIIQSGKVRVFSEKDGKKVEFSVLEAGQIFGESALIQDTVRTASVEALEDCNMIIITRDAFRHKLTKSDPTIKAVIQMLSARITKANTEILKTKGVNVNSFIALLNQLFMDLAAQMPIEERDDFRGEAFPVMKQLVSIIEKHRDKLE